MQLNTTSKVKKLYKLVLKSFAGPFIMTFFIALFILDMQFLWKYIDDLVGKGLEWYLVVELLYYASATVVPLALPLAILLSSLMTFGNLGEHYELVAMKASGISLKRIMLPLVILSVVISLMAFYFSNNILPIANLKFQTLYYDIREKKLAFNIKEGIFYKDIDGYTIRVGKKDKDDIHISDVLIYNHTKRMGNIDVTVAKSGKMESSPDGHSIIFTLYDGYSYAEKVDVRNYRKFRPHERTHFTEQVKLFDLTDFEMNHTDESMFKDHYMMLNLTQLQSSIDSLNKHFEKRKLKFNETYNFSGRINKLLMEDLALIDDSTKKLVADSGYKVMTKGSKEKILLNAASSLQSRKKTILNTIKDRENRQLQIRKHRVIFHEKFTLSVACFVLFFIGAPLGAIIRKGGLGLPVVISVVFFIIFHIISITGKKYVLAGVLEPMIGMWLASASLLPLGIFLTYKATSDAPLLDADSWIKKFQSIFNFAKRIIQSK